MKKVLLASTALIAFGAVSANAAEPIKLGLGGYMIENVGYANNSASEHKTSTDVQSDVNINFVGSTKLDNGISVAVEVDTFGSQRNDSRNVNANCGKTSNLPGGSVSCGNSDVKRSFATISGAFGALVVGEREDVGYIVHNSAPDVGPIGLQDGTWFQWIAPASNHRVYTATNASRYDDRTNKITYVTPSFYGLAAGFTYDPNISLSTSGHTTITSSSDFANYANAGSVNGTDFGGDLYVAGLAYANKFGDVSVKADAGVGQANIANLTVYQGGVSASYAGFTLGGSIFNRHVGDDAHVNGVNNNALAQTAAYAGQSWDAGLSYTTGPYAVSVGYFHDTSKDNQTTLAIGSNGVAGAGVGAADSTQVYSLGGAYTAGPGVTFRAGVEYINYKDGNDSQNSANQNKGIAAVTGVKVDF